MAVINPDEISSILKENIRNYEAKAEVSNVGSVLEVGDGICRIYGLRNVMSNELVEFDDGKGTLGITLNLEEDNVGVVILGEYTHIKEGMVVKTTGRIASVPVGDALIGRIVNPTGRPIDGKGDIRRARRREQRCAEHKPRTIVNNDQLQHQGGAAHRPHNGSRQGRKGLELCHRPKGNHKADRQRQRQRDEKDLQCFTKAHQKI